MNCNLLFCSIVVAQLLLSITATLRPKFALECTSLQQLIQAGPLLDHLDNHAAVSVHQAIVNCFVLPWPMASNVDQDFDRRAQLLQEYIGCLAQDLLRLDHTLASGQRDKVGHLCASHFRFNPCNSVWLSDN